MGIEYNAKRSTNENQKYQIVIMSVLWSKPILHRWFRGDEIQGPLVVSGEGSLHRS